MALYNAWCDRVPVVVMIGNITEADKRAPGAEWVHSAIDPAAIVRDFLKWDDQPQSLQHYAESTVRAPISLPPRRRWRRSCSRSMPSCRKNPIGDRERLRIPKGRQGGAAAGGFRRHRGSRENAGRGRQPGADRRSPGAAPETALQAPGRACRRRCNVPVVDLGGRMNFPSRHPAQPEPSAAPRSIKPTSSSAWSSTTSGVRSTRSPTALSAPRVRPPSRAPRWFRSAPAII